MISAAREYIVDAHTLVWYVADSPRLGADAGAVMDDPDSVLVVPVIALAEACWAVERGRTNIPSVLSLLDDIDADPRILVIPLDRVILDRAMTLAAIPEMHDRPIVSTALLRAEMGVPNALLTCDTQITASGLVPIVW
jgi:PIN domain nuclease of toxin-antitoxin system